MAACSASLFSYSQGNMNVYSEAINKGLATVEKPSMNQINHEKHVLFFGVTIFLTLLHGQLIMTVLV